jgi:hypothetical protein
MLIAFGYAFLTRIITEGNVNLQIRYAFMGVVAVLTAFLLFVYATVLRIERKIDSLLEKSRRGEPN